MFLLWLSLGFLSGVGATTFGGALWFAKYTKNRDIAEAKQRDLIRYDVKDSILEAALRGAGGPVVHDRGEFFDM